MSTTQDQSEAMKLLERATVRIVKARNGYVVKLHFGQFVYVTLAEAFAAVEVYFNKGVMP